MSLIKKMRIKIVLKENHPNTKIYYDSDLGILRGTKQTSHVRYVASPAIMLSKNKKALIRARKLSKETKSENQLSCEAVN